MTTCGCRMYGNQHGSYFKLCEKHYGPMDLAAKSTGETVEQLVNRAIQEYADRVREVLAAERETT